MEPSIPSTTDTRSALQELTAATTNFEREKRFVRIHKAVTERIQTCSYSAKETKLMTEFGDELMAHLTQNVVERQTLLTAASEAYNSSLPPSERSNTRALGKAPDDTAEEKREPKVVTQNETVELLQVFDEVQAESLRDETELNEMYLKIEEILSTGKFRA